MNDEVVPILRVKDAAVAVEWYQHNLGFHQVGQTHRSFDGGPAFVTIVREPAYLVRSRLVTRPATPAVS